MQENKISLLQKIHKIQCAVNGLSKDRSGVNYKYVTGDKVLGEIKPLMNSLGLILKPEVLEINNIRQDYKTGAGKEKSEILSTLKLKFTWIDIATGEREECLFAANGQNDWDKGVGSALTYAERYFLLKFFHITTDEDDIDNPERKKDDIDKKSQTKDIKKPELTPDHKHWLYTKGKVLDGTVTIEEVKEKYNLSDSNRDLLIK